MEKWKCTEKLTVKKNVFKKNPDNTLADATKLYTNSSRYAGDF